MRKIIFVVCLLVGWGLTSVGLIGMYHYGYKCAESEILNSMRQEIMEMEVGEVISGSLDIDNTIEVEIIRTH